MVGIRNITFCSCFVGYQHRIFYSHPVTTFKAYLSYLYRQADIQTMCSSLVDALKNFKRLNFKDWSAPFIKDRKCLSCL